ncbi:MAG: Lipoprotein releasing system transrane protein LolC [Myxococcales bacterium]|nr:Lipoprotein releasing system transrane protein LolC [Myxococcales bacterium]
MLVPGFEWFVAWRHLRDPERRSRRLLKLGLALIVLSSIALAIVALASRRPHAALHGTSGWSPSSLSATYILATTKTGACIGLAVGGLLAFLGALFASFTVFTAISIFGVFLGTGAPIVALSVMSGFEADLKTKIRATKADVVVNMRDDATFTEWQAAQETVGAVPGVVASMAYLESEVIIKHVTNPAGMGIILRGIEPSRAGKVLDLARTMPKGEGKVEYLDHPEQIPTDEADLLRSYPRQDDDQDDDKDGAKDEKKDDAPKDAEKRAKAKTKAEEAAAARIVRPGVLLGEELYARTLRVYLGSDVDIACPMCGVGPSGPMPKLKSFRVAGHFYTGMYEFDSKLAYVSLAEAQKFLGMPGEITGIEVHTSTPEVAVDVASEIERRLGPKFEVRSWEELNRGLFAALKVEKVGMFIGLVFILLVASFSVISTLLMLATKKGREIAILKSMGAENSAVLKIFVAEGLYIGFLGMFFGLATGIAGCLMLSRWGLPLDPDIYYIQKLPVVMRGSEITLICLAAVGLCCLATLYPAWLASRTRPVEGLRYD